MLPRQKGFTLIELLVVIAIIAILAAILFPVFAKARAKARQVSCLSNLKELALAMHMYASDWNDTLPVFAPSYWNWTYGWYTDGGGATCQMCMAILYRSLQPYVNNYQIWFCKDDVWRKYAPSSPAWGTQAAAEAGIVSYMFCTQWNTWLDNTLLCDNGIAADWHVPQGTSSTPGYEFPHNGGLNMAYLDGHVKFLTQAVLATGVHPPLLPYDAP